MNPALYNPRDSDPQQLEALLTGRTELLEEILANLRQQSGGTRRQHWLLRGPRGMGKTHLSGVIYHRVKSDPELRRVYLPLWLGEADVYEVYSPGTLLVKIAERLAEERRDKQLLQRARGLEGVGDEQSFFEAILALLSGEARRHERVLLVLMENLDTLLGSFDRKERAAQTRQLRSVLQHHPVFLFISTTPTRYLSELDDPEQPLHEHLQERDLVPLTEQQVKELHAKLAGESFNAREGALRLRVIHQLTGGLPRSVIMAFTVMQGEQGLGSIIESMRRLLDTQTAYFEARLARLTPRERAIVTTLALAPRNLTLKEIAQGSHLPERSLSTHMQRLVEEGHVRPVGGASGKGALYELSEGLFRLWYQYRKGEVVLEPLVEFMAAWYRAEELQGVIHTLRSRLEGSSPPQRRHLELGLLQAEAALTLAKSDDWQRAREALWEDARKALAATMARPLPATRQEDPLGAIFDIPDPRRRLEELVAWLSHPALQSHLPALISHLTLKAHEHPSLQHQDKLEIFETIIRRMSDQPARLAQQALVETSVSSVVELLALGRFEEGLREADAALERLRATGTLELVDRKFLEYLLLVKLRLLLKAGRLQEAETHLNDLLAQGLAATVSRYAGALIEALQDRFATLPASEQQRVIQITIKISSTWNDPGTSEVAGATQAALLLERHAGNPRALAQAITEGFKDHQGIQIFLSSLPNLYGLFGIPQVLSWVEALLAKEDLEQSHRRQLELHALLVQLVSAPPAGPKAAGTTLAPHQVDASRLPPELRQPLEHAAQVIRELLSAQLPGRR